jgi:hypothetical protein
MTIEKIKKLNWLVFGAIFWGAVGILCILPAGALIMFFDSPSPNWNANYFFIFSVISFPIVCIISSVAILFLKNNYNKLAFYVFLLPVIFIIFIYMGENWMSASKLPMPNQRNATPIAKCASLVLDVMDGLETTGCGLLENDTTVTGITNTTSEAHNWQFSYPNKTGPITIILKSDGTSCPQFSILDIEGNPVLDYINTCETRLFGFEFYPSSEGTYILRVFTPEKPGAYWLRIHKH